MTSAGETCFQFVAGNDAGTSVCVFVNVGMVKKQPTFISMLACVFKQ